MHIERRIDMNAWIDETLTDMRLSLPPEINEKCPHCGLVIRYPLIATASDIKLFKELIAAAHAVMDRHGITANLLADIYAECMIAIGRQGRGTPNTD